MNDFHYLKRTPRLVGVGGLEHLEGWNMKNSMRGGLLQRQSAQLHAIQFPICTRKKSCQLVNWCCHVPHVNFTSPYGYRATHQPTSAPPDCILCISSLILLVHVSNMYMQTDTIKLRYLFYVTYALCIDKTELLYRIQISNVLVRRYSTRYVHHNLLTN